ncbi:DUF5823 family protein [Paenibacillus tepidiphilus]|uniref:DUF5823 family protein n=1 Tax=Paenibacillus tepidiphilus TaxID=2608683 RepID=UPI00123B7217|nr:DUF5823 family protein [Paenibacillus tepidiphilus]
MVIETVRTVVNYLIDLLSGDLPALYYRWIVLLLAVQIIQLTVTYRYFKTGKGFAVYFAEGTAGFAVLILAGILLSKFFAFIIEDAFIRSSGMAHAFISLIITTAYVATEGLKLLLRKKVNDKDRRFLLMLALALTANSLCFYWLLPLTEAMFLASRAFMVTMIVAVSILMLILYHFEEEEASPLTEKSTV